MGKGNLCWDLMLASIHLGGEEGKEAFRGETRCCRCKVVQSCPTLCDPMDCSLPGPSAHGIFQARVLEWSAIAFSWRDLSAAQNPPWPWGVNPFRRAGDGIRKSRDHTQFSSVPQSCPTLGDPMGCSTPGHHQLPELAQTHVHQVGDCHPTISSSIILLLLLSIFPSIRVSSSTSHQVAKVLKFQLQHQSFQ